MVFYCRSGQFILPIGCFWAPVQEFQKQNQKFTLKEKQTRQGLRLLLTMGGVQSMQQLLHEFEQLVKVTAPSTP